MAVRELSKILAQYIPRRGNTSALAVSRDYLEALKQGSIEYISQGLMRRFMDNYEIPVEEFNSLVTELEAGYDPREDPDQALLHTFEQGARYSQAINRRVRLEEYITKQKMVDILRSDEHTITVPGKLSLAVHNLANYFALTSPQLAGLFGTSDEIPLLTEQGHSLRPEEFLHVGGEEGNRLYTVNKEFLPGIVKRLYTDDTIWKPRYIDSEETFSGKRERPVSLNHNQIIIEFNKPLSKEAKDALDNDVIQKSLFANIIHGYGNIWLSQYVWMDGDAEREGRLPFTRPRAIFSWQDEQTLRMNVYPFKIMTPWTETSYNQYRPTVEQMQFMNRITYRSSHPEGQKNKILRTG
ncbi:MAG: hypothetical protein ACLFNB_02390 [Candidatus Woesearchaeota archaeon]